jgi:antitoxin VapB
MAISIKDPEVERLVRELAAKRGWTLTQTIKTSVQREAVATNDAESDDDFFAAVRRAQDAVAAAPPRADLTDDEVLGYDAAGVPTR